MVSRAATRSGSLEDVLRRLGSKLEAWQVRALFLGAQASTNVRLGPQHLLGHLFEGEPMLGDSLDDANASLGVIMGTWNELVDDHRRGRIRLSEVRVGKPPTAADVAALTERLAEEIVWFTRGIDAGGDDPMEFGPEGQEILGRLAESSAFCQGYKQVLAKKQDHVHDEITESIAALGKLGESVAGLMSDLLDVGAEVRKRAVAEYTAAQGGETDDGVPIRRAVKVGRNEACPCGSGRKWKRCCGAPQRVQ